MDWAFPARKGRECGERWQEGHRSPGQQPCRWEVTGKEDGAVRELGVEGRSSMTQHHKAGKPELHEKGRRRKEYRPIKRSGIQSPAI